MTNINDWRQTRREMTKSELLAHPEMKDWDELSMGNVQRAFVYDYAGVFSFILQRQDALGEIHFAWCFTHPCDIEEATLDEAERELFAFLYPDTEESLYIEFGRWCEREHLPDMSADELLHEDITVEQRKWLTDFSQRWEEMITSKHALRSML